MRLVLLLGAVLLSACGSSQYALPDVSLPTAAGAKVSLRSCAGPKCLYVYVAPWCPHCREAAPYILKLRDFLKPQGITTTVIVGQDQRAAIVGYARVFGPGTALDFFNDVKTDGVPEFLVTDSKGALVKKVGGFPPGYDGPVSELAAHLGLP